MPMHMLFALLVAMAALSPVEELAQPDAFSDIVDAAHVQEPLAEVGQSPKHGGLRNSKVTWISRPYRSDRGKPRKPQLAPVPPELRPTPSNLTTPRAAAPSTAFAEGSLTDAGRNNRKNQGETVELLAPRLAAGRTIPNLVAAMDARLFSVAKAEVSRSLAPKRGLFASRNGQDVFILSAFERHRVPVADVVPIRPDRSGQTFTAKLKNTMTCKQIELDNVGVHFHAWRPASSRASTALKFRRADASTANFQEASLRHLAFQHFRGVLEATGDVRGLSEGQPMTLPEMQPRRILPACLRAHLGVFEGRQQPHCAWPRTDEKSVGFVLDLPLPIPYDNRGYICTTCKNDPRVKRCPTYRLDDDDLHAAFPGLLIHRGHKSKLVCMSKRFLVHLILSFYEVLNARATRRKLVEYYTGNALMSPSSLAWSFSAVPRCRALRGVLMKALQNFLGSAVASMKARLYRYAGQGIRGDGNYQIATRIRARTSDGRTERPYSVLLAWCGVDGCLLKPVVPSKTEDFPDLAADLEPMLDDLRHERLTSGLSLLESAPVFQSTDVYGKHRRLYAALYKRKWHELTVETTSATPKGDAAGALAAQDVESGPTLCVGEPFHDVIALRRVASPASNDCRDFIFDHQHMIDCLSASLYENEVPTSPTIEDLSEGAGSLLQDAVRLPVAEFKRRRLEADAVHQEELKSFLQQPAAVHANAWTALFNAKPPRGTLSRLARRMSVTVHASLKKHNYATQRDFRREVRKLRKWYRPGRKQSRHRRGILRSRSASAQVRGLRSVFNKKVALHYKRLLKPLRQEGLWKWRLVALSLHRAGMPVHSGTIPVERLWASLKDMLPSAARFMTVEWFNTVAALAFLRYNYRHFHHRLLPSWTESDSLMAERIDNLGAAARLLYENVDDAIPSQLFDAFL
jgi:hypothetical protein